MLWLWDYVITDNNIINNFVGSGGDICITTSHFKVLCVSVYRGMDILIRNTSRRRV